MTPLERSIVQTVAYFDLFDFPLTYPELYRYLWQPPHTTTLSAVMVAARQLPQLIEHSGFVMFKGRETLAETRQQRYVTSELKFNKRRRLLWLFSLLPGVQAIYLVNTMAYQNVRVTSDLDLLMIAQPKKIWAVRFYTTLLAKLLGVRPRPGHTKDALCLSFFATPNGITQLPELRRNDEDALEGYWLAQALPIYDPNHTAEQMVDSQWLKTVLPHTLPANIHFNRSIQHTWLHIVGHTLGQLILWNGILKQLQLWVMPKQLKQLAGPLESGIVVLTDDVMKFHTRDPRPELQARWQKTIDSRL